MSDPVEGATRKLAEAMKAASAAAKLNDMMAPARALEKAMEPMRALERLADPFEAMRVASPQMEVVAAAQKATGAVGQVSAAAQAVANVNRAFDFSKGGLPAEIQRTIDSMTTVSDKIRALAGYDLPRADIAKALGIRYQHVRNVLVRDEEKASESDAGGDESADKDAPAYVRLGPGGRVVIPAAIREALGLKENEQLLIEVTDGEVRLVPYAKVIRKVQALVRKHVPEDVSLVDALLRERREETRQEHPDD
ncbi:MAG TPA: AbrB/MazE/SpoVT family DNA-binding domain-containing protein [Beijerinckiaceae bacterium]|nr:AbrB/MazE/SpoVT family DNA-binding domain-containing protein [Beijerinckiaceae bacterium]